jgi:hypothetical protein
MEKAIFFDEQGQEAHIYEMEVDNAQYPLEDLTNYDHYMDLKPSEKPMKILEETEEKIAAHECIVERTTLRSNQKYTDSEKERFFFLSVRASFKLVQGSCAAQYSSFSSSNMEEEI